MTDALINMAQVDQEEHPLLDDPEIETIEDAASDNSAGGEGPETVEVDDESEEELN